MGTPSAPDTDHFTVAVVVVATISTVFPGFLVGALSVQVSAEFDVAEGTYGWGLGGFFLAATVGSVALGRLAQIIGPRRQILAALLISATVQLGIAIAADSFGMVVAGLAVCGFVNSGNQTAVNFALARARLERLGLGIALKQSGMPTASLLSGLAVPAFALTVGWRWAFVFGAGFALVAAALVLRVIEPFAPDERRRASVPPRSARRSLVLAGAAGAFLAFGAGALNAWVVASGVDAGLGDGAAGLVLSLAAATGIAVRLSAGFRLDSMRRRPFSAAGITVLVGAVGMAALAARVPMTHVLATLLAFGAGWIWPVFTNFGIVRANEGAAGSATGITQMGVYVGVFTAPLVTGWIIERSGFGVMWMVVAASTVIGAFLALIVADDF